MGCLDQGSELSCLPMSLLVTQGGREPSAPRGPRKIAIANKVLPSHPLHFPWSELVRNGIDLFNNLMCEKDNIIAVLN